MDFRDEIDRRWLWDIIKHLYLSDMEYAVLEHRFKYGYTLEETGKRVGRNRERVRQLEAKALRKLRHPYRASILNESYGIGCDYKRIREAELEEREKGYIKRFPHLPIPEIPEPVVHYVARPIRTLIMTDQGLVCEIRGEGRYLLNKDGKASLLCWFDE